MNSFDVLIVNYISSIRTPFLTDFMYVLSTVFDFSIYTIIITICFAILIYFIKNKKTAIMFFSAMAVTAISVYILKLIFNVERPPHPIFDAFGQSFPSYHSAISTVMFGMFIYILKDDLKRFWKTIFSIFCIFLVILVSFSRLYLGVHWFSDILGGILLGIIILYISIKIFQNSLDEDED